MAKDYPFCTIDPNVAKVPYMDERLNILQKKFQSQKIIYADLEFFDIAGLIKGASSGAGLGNQFLAHISEVDLIIHFVRCFKGSVQHVENRIDSILDLEIIMYELQEYDLSKLARLKEKYKKDTEKLILLEKVKDNINTFTPNDDEFIKSCHFLCLKPFIVVGNGNSKECYELRKYCEQHNYIFIDICIDHLTNLSLFDDNTEYLRELSKIISCVYKKLNLITYFTVGPKEARAWRISANTTAQYAAGAIHSDFIKNFIRAKCTPFNNLDTHIMYTKTSIVNDGDILLFYTS